MEHAVYCSNQAYRVRPQHYLSDGVRSVQYSRVAIERRPLYTWISVTLPEPPQKFRGYDRTYISGSVALHLTSSLSLLWLCLLLSLLFSW